MMLNAARSFGPEARQFCRRKEPLRSTNGVLFVVVVVLVVVRDALVFGPALSGERRSAVAFGTGVGGPTVVMIV